MSNEKHTRQRLYSAAERQQLDLGESWPLTFAEKHEDWDIGFQAFIVQNADEFSCIEDVEDFEIEQRANARRACALWNAAHDLNLSTEAIEAGVIGDLLSVTGDYEDHLYNQLDDMICNAGNPDGGSSATCEHCQLSQKLAQARAAIQKAQPAAQEVANV